MKTRKYESCLISSAGTRAASGRRRPAQDQALTANRRVPSPPPGTTPVPMEDAFMSAAWGLVVAGGPVGRTRFGLGGGRSHCSLLPSRSLRVVRVARLSVSGHPRPCWARRGRRGGLLALVFESHPSDDSGDTGAPPAGGPVAPPRPARRRDTSARPARADQSEHHRRAGGCDQNLDNRARRKYIPTILITYLSVGLIFAALLTLTLYLA